MHDANDLSDDFFLDDRPPRHETEAEPVIDHGKPPAGELGRADQLAANGLTIFDRVESKAPFRGELPSDALDLLTFEGGQAVASRPHASLRSAPGMALPDQFVLPPSERAPHLGAKASFGKHAGVAADQLPVEPRRTVADYLAVEIVGRQDPKACPAALSRIVSLGTDFEIIRDLPAVGLGPLDNAGAAQCFQPADVALDVGVKVAARNAHMTRFGDRSMLARKVLARAFREFGDVAIGRSWRRRCAPDLDDGAEPCLFSHGGPAQHHMVDAPVDAINDDTDPVAQFVGQFLTDDPADHRDRSRTAMQED